MQIPQFWAREDFTAVNDDGLPVTRTAFGWSLTSQDDAVRLANDTEDGLISYVFTRDLARGQRMIDRIDTGMMGLNVGVVSNAAGPFGGMKQSGVGRELGPHALDYYTEVKNVYLATEEG